MKHPTTIKCKDCGKFGVQYGTYCKRIKCGWDPECAAFLMPVNLVIGDTTTLFIAGAIYLKS
jgi:hypothetical protein